MTVSVSSVALVGSACRLPSANGLEEFWQVLDEGRCVVSAVQEDRFGTERHRHPSRATPGRSVSFAAGQLARPFDFDPGYFGISPREAGAMDPQQRILLEVAVEALENAGIPADRLAGEAVGVYVGASSLDYGTHAQLDTAALEPQSMTGNTLSIIANRLSYVFDLRGPSYVLDTACSSSLIALHRAIEDIRMGRVETAIVGGVSMLLHPVPFIGFSRASMLSANGLCRAFDAAADGYVRSEGAVALVLRAEAAARGAGDPLRARFLASGINSDGRTAGLSLPSMDAQAELLRRTYREAEIDPDRLAYVEAHGTGTPIGDPIEAEALGTVLGRARQAPLPIGSAKTNFGHLEPASGLVGVLKCQLAMAHDRLPASLHFERANPHIAFEALNLQVVDQGRPLPRSSEPRLAGVNSFGFGGANAHVVIEEGEPSPAPAEAALPAAPLVISAASEAGLKALAARTTQKLRASGDVRRHANAAAHRRQRLAHRAVIAPGPVAATLEALDALKEGTAHEKLTVGEAAGADHRPVFLYSGNGSQWAGMGRVAYQAETDFMLSFDRADRAFMSVAGWSLVSMLFSGDLQTEIERTEIAQPLLFALQVALTEALQRRGLSPAMIIGHSVGEVAAAWACGALSLTDAVQVIHARSTHQEVTRHLGGMAALLLPEAEAAEAIASYQGVEIAAINSPRSVTVSGPSEALNAFLRDAHAKRLVTKRLGLDYPFHCALVEPIKAPLLASLSRLSPRSTAVPMLSSVTGELVAGEDLSGAYWWDNVRCAVRFADPIAQALQRWRLFIEIGPKPVLTGYVADIARTLGSKATVLPSFQQNDAGDEPIGRILAAAIANGATVDEAAVFGPLRAGPDGLPSYPWQHAYHRHARTVELVRLREPREHVLLGDRLRLDTHEWRLSLDAARLPFLADHRLAETTLFPGAGFAEMLLAAGRALHPERPLEVHDLELIAPLVLDEGAEREVRTREIAPASFVIESRERLAEDGWTLNAKATVRPAPAEPQCVSPHEGLAPTGEERTIQAAELYEITARFGLPYGPTFRRASRVRLLGDRRAQLQLSPPDPATARLGFALDPTLFDSCFHALFPFVAGRDLQAETTVLPVRIGRLVLGTAARQPVAASILITMADAQALEARFVLFDTAGDVVATVDGVRFQTVPLSVAAEGAMLTAVPILKRIARAADPSCLEPALPDRLFGADASEPADDVLLLEAGVQAAAAAALAPVLREPASLEAMVGEGYLAASAMPLAARLLHALEAAGQVAEEDGRWQVVAEPIAVADVVALLIAEHPARLPEATVLAALSTWLAAVLADGLRTDEPPLADPLFAQLLTDAPFASGLYLALGEGVTALLPPAPSALSVGIVGATNLAFLRRVAKLVDVTRVRLVISDRDPRVLDKAALVWTRTPGVALIPFETLASDGHPFDLLIVPPGLGPPEADELRGLLKPHGLLLGAAFAPSLFADAFFGLCSGWWDASLDPKSPIGRLATAQEWRDALIEAGFSEPKVAPVADAAADGLIYLATNAPQAAALATQPLPSLHAHGSLAQKTLAALSAQGEGVGPVLSLTDVPEGDCVIAVDDADPATLPATLAALGAFLAALGTQRRAVTLVSFAGQTPNGADLNPAAAALAGFARVAINEFAHLDIRLVDLARDFDPSVAAVRLLSELQQPNAELEIVLTSDDRSAMRYLPMPTPARTGGDELRLAIDLRGSIDNLVWQAVSARPPGPNEVRIALEATGLNFRDVMWTLGLLPYEALQDGFAGATLGMECAGTVAAVGAGVSHLAVGDAVVAFAPASFASQVTVTADAVIGRPAGMDAAAAATIPVAFLTAYYALVELADLEEGESVLIHGGAGGVGLAALQIARWRGARVFATAGTVEKRALLSALGAEAVFDSRALTFADEIVAATGEGVDVVLNSLAGEAMERSLDALKPFGRFLELGKRDFYGGTKLGLRPFRRNLSYFGIDADQLMKRKAKQAKRLLGEIMDLFGAGDLTPLPYRMFPPEGVREAFRLMQNAGHIGKIVVRAPEPTPLPRRPRVAAIEPQKSYLLVGGASGFGFATAQWLIEEGARHLVLASRSGVRDEAIAAAIERHRQAGVVIDVVTLDVTDAAAVRQVVEEANTVRPLGGVFHMAVVLDDALIPSLDEARHATAMAPKIAGAEALEAATDGLPLDLFVLYSSITVQLGNPGQANYVAANAYLEAVAKRRRAKGKPALAIAWGAIGDVGLLARDAKRSELVKRKLGGSTMTAAEGLAELTALLAEGAMLEGSAVRMIGKVDWSSACKDLKLVASPTFEDLAEEGAAEGEDPSAVDLARRLEGLSEAEALAEVSRLLATEVSRILKLPVGEIEVHKPLTAIGMDSLMGLELRLAAEKRLGIAVPMIALAAGATLTDLARKVVVRERGEAAQADGAIETLASQHVGAGEDADGLTELTDHMRETGAKMRTIIE